MGEKKTVVDSSGGRTVRYHVAADGGCRGICMTKTAQHTWERANATTYLKFRETKKKRTRIEENLHLYK